MTVPTGNVTFLLTDIEGSTRNWETSESDMRAALIRHDDLLAWHIREHSGAVLTERGEGDSFFAVFPTANGAVAAGASLQDLGQHRLRDLTIPERVFQLTRHGGGARRIPALNGAPPIWLGRCRRSYAEPFGARPKMSRRALSA
jgi:class 3 adenylate cyclase